MIPQFDPSEARYLAEIIVSILGVLLFFALAVWMIWRKQKSNAAEAVSRAISEETQSAAPAASYSQNTDRRTALEYAYQAWKAERLLQAEDGRSLFVRTGVEKSGLRYQLVASTQVQAFAILVSTLMATSDPQASTQAEALFASLLAHPAYGQAELSSWSYLPDLPRSPKLDPDPQAEAWVIYALLNATRRWPALNRFNYSELIQARVLALHGYIENVVPELKEQLPFSGYMVKHLQAYTPDLDWSELGSSRESFYSQLEDPDLLASEFAASHLGFSLLQLGMLALLERDSDSQHAIRNARPVLVQLIEDCISSSSTQPDFSRTAFLSCCVPALLMLQDQEINNRVWNDLVSTTPDKNDGLGATLKVLGMAFLTNRKM